MRTQYFFYLCVGVLLLNPAHVRAHSIEQLKSLFDPTPIPEELLEATKVLADTAGLNSIRETAHSKQHALLDQYLRALADRKCRLSMANLSVIDREIVDFRDKGITDIEQALREKRDATAASIETDCTEASVKPSQNPAP